MHPYMKLCQTLRNKIKVFVAIAVNIFSDLFYIVSSKLNDKK
jgi:hypothetical protein